MITIEEIKRYRWMHAIDAAEAMTKVHLPTKYGDFMLESFETPDQEEPTLLITKGELQPDEPLLLRVHSECLTGASLAHCAVIAASSLSAPCS